MLITMYILKTERSFSLLADCKAKFSNKSLDIRNHFRLMFNRFFCCIMEWFFTCWFVCYCLFFPSLAMAISPQRDKHFMHHRVIITSWKERHLVKDSMNYAKMQIRLKTKKHQQIEPVYSFQLFNRPNLLSLHTKMSP